MNFISKKRRAFNLNSLALAGAFTATIVPITSAHAEQLQESTGWIDVYVDHTDLDEAISQAESAGLTIVHDNSVVLTGDADATVVNTKTATDYYKTKETEIEQATAKYKADLLNYEAEQKRNDQDAANANAIMASLRTNLAINKQTVVTETKPYSAQALEADTQRIQAQIAAGTKYQEVRASVASANATVEQLVGFKTQASQGNIRLTTKNVVVASKEDVQRYVDQMRADYARMEEYVRSLNGINGAIPAEDRPEFKTYTFTIAPQVVADGTAPVKVSNYTPIQAVKPAVPVINYHLYDVRSTPQTDRHTENADGEVIIEATKASSNGQKVVQAMVNQTVGVETDNQPLPSERFDKIHNLEIVTYLPDGVTYDDVKSNIDGENWEATYNKATNTVRLRATGKYLVKVNKNQNLNNAGTVGGTVNGQWEYDAPAVYFKLDKDDTVYQVHSETIVNDEYLVVGDTVTIRTDSADPEKHNTNSKFVNIDGKAVLPGSINNYQIIWDFNQYLNVNIDREMQGKTLILADVYNHVALTYNGVATVAQKDGTVVPLGQGFNVVNVKYADLKGDEYNGLKAKIKATAKEQGGNVEEYSAVVVQATGVDATFYKKYVEGGQQLVVTIPMTTNKIDNTPDKQGGTYNGNTYYNVAFQSDFGNDYKSNTVENNVPLIDPRKDAVLSFAQLATYDINKNPLAEIENGTEFFYRLSGSAFPMNLSEDTFYYAMTDEMNVKADEYTGSYLVESNNPITFKPGTALYNRYAATKGVMAANSDVTKYTTQTIARNVSSTLNTPTGAVDSADKLITRVIIAFDSDFMSQIDWSKTALQVDTFLRTKRIADLDKVTNIYNEVINAIDFGSNEVITNTKANAVDVLKQQLEALTGRMNEDDKDDAKFQAETTSALSVIVKTIQNNKAAQEAADDKLENKIIENTTNIAKNTSNIANNTTNIANNTTNIAKNTATIDAVQKLVAALRADVDTNTSNISKNTELLNSVNEAANKALAQSEAKFSNVTIYDISVTTDAEALAWATNHGIGAGSIKSITLDEDNRFVVRYNTSTTATNGSTQATIDTNNVNAVAQTRKTVNLYTVKSNTEAYAKLAELGYPKDSVAKLTNNGSVWTAIVVPKAPKAPKADGAVNEAVETITEIKTVEDAAKFQGFKINLFGSEYILVEAKDVTDTTVTYTAKAIIDGKVSDKLVKVSVPKATVLKATK